MSASGKPRGQSSSSKGKGRGKSPQHPPKPPAPSPPRQHAKRQKARQARPNAQVRLLRAAKAKGGEKGGKVAAEAPSPNRQPKSPSPPLEMEDDSWADDLCSERLRADAPSEEVATMPPPTQPELLETAVAMPAGPL